MSFQEKGEGDLRHRGEGHMKTDAEIRAMGPHGKEHQDSPQPPETKRGHKMDFPLEPPEGTNPANNLILDFWAPEL